MQPHSPGYRLSIGKPIPNTNVYILSRDPTSMRPVPIGQVGCMWVGGVGVSDGYLNLPHKTAERWKPDPFLGNGGMMFNTGDLGRWRKDGQLDHLGRADDQVKVKGFRVELDGVAAAMRVSIAGRNLLVVKLEPFCVYRLTSQSEMLLHCWSAQNSGDLSHLPRSISHSCVTPQPKCNHTMQSPVNTLQLSIFQLPGMARSTNEHWLVLQKVNLVKA